MSYEVLARKWRPQTFEDVVGQEHVVKTLKNAIKSNRLAHAYLFVGPRGIGKTSIARIFAKALNCQKGPTETPCGKCDSCKEIAAGTGLDVIEIDGASNNSVEQIRDLRNSVAYAPTHGKYKIYYIDEVHMLSGGAFNALLKTLEEPPAHVKFFFATTEVEKVLPTIISRCQRFDLKNIPIPQMIERLKLIAKDESVKIDDDALIAIARGASGGLRDAESALDQLISFRGNKIAEEDVLSVFGLVSRTNMEVIAESIIKGDASSVIKIVNDLDESGKDLYKFAAELMEYFRNLLIILNVKDVKEVSDLTDDQIATAKRQSALTNTDKVLRIMAIIADTHDKMRYALSRKTILEAAMIRASRAASVASLEEILVEINRLKASGDIGASAGEGGQPGFFVKSR